MLSLKTILCNSRFLIIPTVQVPNLASHVLSQSINRLCDDWLERYARTTELPENPPTLQEAVHMIASLGGFWGRKSDKELGTITLW
jgi:hypothetical protein